MALFSRPRASTKRPARRWPWQRRWDAWWQARHPASDTTALTQRNLYILPSRPGAAFVATLLVLLLASINDQLSLGYLLTFLLAGAGLASMHTTHGNLRGLKLDLKTPAPTHAGRPLTLDIRLHNPGKARFGVGVRLPEGKAADTAFADAPAQGHAQLHLQLSFPSRGRHALPRLRIESRFPLGLFVTWSYWRPAALAWVYPAPEVDAPPAAAVEEGLPQGQGQPGLGDDPGLRPYRHGDSPRQILWRKSALALAQPRPPSGGGGGTALLVRERLGSRASEQWLDIAATRGLPFEARLSRLAAWVQRAEDDGLPYGLRLRGVALSPDLGPDHFRACMEALAMAQDQP
ncbi:DUF58 domain-containing protein [Mitsuaria sp. GD03876]|uniref:DUF58 domain-containing protein n=1 Tax=Mitsuaria sp. GD03876 TaxID=2975399 RepID=UPI002449DCD9|nr:DUF58 domain-containing protein [Mitsuaria sp. GD03876]MDH0865950.1 DUF58 domain-containing protein [Mitsuaria sp. GD03876]